MSNIRKEPLLPPLWVIVTFLLVVLCWVLYQLKEIVMLLVVGYCIAYLMIPALKYLEKRKVSRSIGVFFIFTLAAVFIVLLAVTAIPTILEEYRELSSNLPRYIEIARAKFSELGTQLSSSLSISAASLENAQFSSFIPSINGETLNGIFKAVGNTLLKGYSITLTLVNLALLPFIVFYIAVDFEEIHNKFLMLTPAKHRAFVTSIGSEINTYVSAFVRGQMLVAFILFFSFCNWTWSYRR